MSDPKSTTPRDSTPKTPAAPLPDAALDAVSGGISAGFDPALGTGKDWRQNVIDAAPNTTSPRTQP